MANQPIISTSITNAAQNPHVLNMAMMAYLNLHAAQTAVITWLVIVRMIKVVMVKTIPIAGADAKREKDFGLCRHCCCECES